MINTDGYLSGIKRNYFSWLGENYYGTH